MNHPEQMPSGILEIHLPAPVPEATHPSASGAGSLLAFNGLALLFAATPSQVTEVSAGIEAHRIPGTRGADGVWRLQWDRRAESGLLLQVEFSGPDPLLTDAYWCRRPNVSIEGGVATARGPHSERIPSEEQLSQVRFVPRGEGEPGASYEIANPGEEDPSCLLFRHADWIVDSTDEVAALAVDQLTQLRKSALKDSLACRLFFLELDELRSEGSSTCLDEADARAFRESIRFVQYGLITRLQVRAELYRRGLQPHFPKQGAEGLQAISSGFIALFEAHLARRAGDSHRSDRRDLWGTAFDQFATDRGGVFHADPRCSALLIRQGVPDGEFFLCFGELALQCIDEQVDPGFWRARLLDLVRATHMFVEHRAPHGWFARDPHPLVDRDGQPRSMFGFSEGLAYPRRRRAELQNEYSEIARRLTTQDAQERVLRTRFSRLVGECLRCYQAFGRGPFRTEEQLAGFDPQPLDAAAQSRPQDSPTA